MKTSAYPTFPLALKLTAAACLLSLAGCSGLSKGGLSLPDLRVPGVSLPPAAEGFQKRYYAGAGFGSSSLDPDTTGSSFTGESQSAFGSQLRFGYDMHDRFSLEFDSSQLGEAELDQGVSLIKYSSFAASALVYGLGSDTNRSSKTGFNAYGRIGYSYNRRSSNVLNLGESNARPIVGLGAEYGFRNGLGVRAEVTRYDSDSMYVGLGAILRFGSFRQFMPQHLAKRKNSDVSVYGAGSRSAQRQGQRGGALRVSDRFAGEDSAQQQFDYVTPLKVTVLANANDHDADGVANADDLCADTVLSTAVGSDGCGLFDGTLANSSFANGSAKLNSSVRASLDHLAEQLILFPEVRVAIEAYTDDKGPEDININVARTRAEIVRQYLVRKGVNADQLDPRGMGEINPIADNSTESGRDANRRIEFLTLPSLTAEEIAEGTRQLDSGRKQLAVKKPAVEKSIFEQHMGSEPTLAAAKAAIDTLPGPALVPGLHVNGVLEGVEFEAQSNTLTAESAAPIKRLALALQNDPTARIAIMAHTNDLPTPAENLKLSVKQARVVLKEMVKAGVSRRQLRAEGYGDTLPRIQGISERHRKFNRRIELRIIGR